MRVSRQMRDILKVLSGSDNPLKLTQIILKVKKLKPIRKRIESRDGKPIEVPPFIQLELVSALAGESVSWFMGRNLFTGKDLRPYHEEADKLYVSFGRSIKNLWKNGLVEGIAGSNPYPKFWRRRQFLYRITKKGRSRIRNLWSPAKVEQRVARIRRVSSQPKAVLRRFARLPVTRACAGRRQPVPLMLACAPKIEHACGFSPPPVRVPLLEVVKIGPATGISFG